MRLIKELLRFGIGRIRPKRARRDISSPKQTVRPIASGPLETIVGFSMLGVPDSRLIISRQYQHPCGKLSLKFRLKEKFTYVLSRFVERRLVAPPPKSGSH